MKRNEAINEPTKNIEKSLFIGREMKSTKTNVRENRYSFTSSTYQSCCSINSELICGHSLLIFSTAVIHLQQFRTGSNMFIDKGKVIWLPFSSSSPSSSSSSFSSFNYDLPVHSIILQHLFHQLQRGAKRANL